MATITDNFDRTDAASLGSSSEGWSWAEIRASNNFGITGNKAYRHTGSPLARAASDLGSADHYVEAQISNFVSTNSGGLMVRVHATNNTGYVFVILNNGTNTYRIMRWAGSFTLVGSAVNATPPSNPFTARLVASGNTIKGYINDVEVISVTDSTYTTETRGGMYSSGVEIDNFEAGDGTGSGGGNTITITTPVQYRTYQRDGSDQADIPITGTYTGTPTAIEASFNGGAYATIDASPAGGTYSGTLTNQAAGQGTLTVRFTNDTAVNASVADIGIGDVFLVAGQSNAAGRFTNNQSYSHATLKATMFREDDAWAELADPTESGSTDGSVWPLLATLIMAETDLPVAFITTAEGGTGLTDGDWVQGGTQYNNALSQVTASAVNAVKGVLYQGLERDIAIGATQGDVQTALSLMLDNMQADNTALVNAKMVLGLVAFQTSVTDAAIDAVRAAIINRWDNDSDILAGPTGHDQDFADGLHWTTDQEATTLSQRWWRALLYHFYGGSESPRGPQFVSATYTGSVVTVTFTGGQGALQNADDATGWVVTDDGTPITVNSAAANGANKIDLTLASAPSGTVLVYFCSGDTGEGATLSDSGTYPLPPEPIVGQTVTEATTSVAPQFMHYMRARQMA